MATVIKVVQGDVGFDIEFVCKDKNGTVIDLTGGSVKFKMGHPGDTAKIDAACTLTDEANGECKYTTQDGDLDTCGIYDAELEITLGSKVLTIRDIKIHVYGDI